VQERADFAKTECQVALLPAAGPVSDSGWAGYRRREMACDHSSRCDAGEFIKLGFRELAFRRQAEGERHEIANRMPVGHSPFGHGGAAV
jgi:hypothetical protein